MLALLLPVLRADLKLLETYHFQTEAPLNIPLYALGGADDTVAGRENILAWEQHTTADWASQFFNGGHFYFREGDQTPFFNYLRASLDRWMGG
jgi:medium-chain acyl-[acyl-carrier-protein] hydrolase